MGLEARCCRWLAAASNFDGLIDRLFLLLIEESALALLRSDWILESELGRSVIALVGSAH